MTNHDCACDFRSRTSGIRLRDRDCVSRLGGRIGPCISASADGKVSTVVVAVCVVVVAVVVVVVVCGSDSVRCYVVAKGKRSISKNVV